MGKDMGSLLDFTIQEFWGMGEHHQENVTDL